MTEEEEGGGGGGGGGRRREEEKEYDTVVVRLGSRRSLARGAPTEWRDGGRALKQCFPVDLTVMSCLGHALEPRQKHSSFSWTRSYS